MADQAIRVGLIGAGRNTRERHIPGFQKVAGVEIAAVANRSRESGRRVADQFNIPTVYDNWRDLLEDPTLDAVCIGTWPYMHRTLVVASLEAGKHVLCEARMAATAEEAHEMLAVSKEFPDLVAQIVPSPTTFKVDNLLTELVNDGFIGQLVAIELQVLGTEFVDRSAPLHWRHERRYSGYNIMNMGIWYEAMMRWVGPATKVAAMTKINAPARKDESGQWQSVTIPDHVDILFELASGAPGHMRVSSVTGLSGGSEVWIYGTEGTVKVDNRFNVYGGKRGEKQLREISNPPEKQYSWQVESEFINSVRNRAPVLRTPLDVGVQYMEFTEAVTRSAQSGQTVTLPL